MADLFDRDINTTVYVLEYKECKNIISQMEFADESSLFGNEKDDSLKAVFPLFIKFLSEKNYIQVWKKKRQICYIL